MDSSKKNISGDKRDAIIVRTSVIGIATNLMLAVLKAVIGIAVNSIAVILDAINNLSDVLSSVITIAGTKLAGKKPDKKHPLGHGRIEYLTAMFVSGIVLYAGIASAIQSVKKMLHPQVPEHTLVSLAIIAVAVIAKVILGKYVKSQGRRVNSTSLVASGSDAMYDAILSLSVLISAIFFMTTGISLEAYVAALISCFIIRAGLGMMGDTVSDILGRRADKETTDRIKQLLANEPQVKGVYDLMLFNFGPDRNYASVHLELPDSMTVDEVARLTRTVESKVYHETGVIMTGVGVYSHNTGDTEAARIKADVCGKVMAHKWAVEFHGFHLDSEAREMRFDVVTSFDIAPREAIRILHEELAREYPDYTIHIVPDVDVSN